MAPVGNILLKVPFFALMCVRSIKKKIVLLDNDIFASGCFARSTQQNIQYIFK